MERFRVTIEDAKHLLTWSGWAFDQADAEYKAKLAWELSPATKKIGTTINTEKINESDSNRSV